MIAIFTVPARVWFERSKDEPVGEATALELSSHKISKTAAWNLYAVYWIVVLITTSAPSALTRVCCLACQRYLLRLNGSSRTPDIDSDPFIGFAPSVLGLFAVVRLF